MSFSMQVIVTVVCKCARGREGSRYMCFIYNTGAASGGNLST